MTAINPALVPTIAPGSIFSNFSTATSLNIRWYTATDPVYYEVLNRPLADITLRQLILAKAVDNLNLQLGHQTLYPFVVQPQITIGGTSFADVPLAWIWDINTSLPTKWSNLRLAKIIRLSGSNGIETSGTYTGIIRLLFTASEDGSEAETSIFYADYEIDSDLTYQRSRLTVVTTADEVDAIIAAESETVAGSITFRTLDQSEEITQAFYNFIDPPGGSSDDVDSNGHYVTPTEYQVVSSLAGTADITGDFSLSGLSHGTGLLSDSALSPIPSLDSDIQSWITATNYPFAVTATLGSIGTYSVTIPGGLFREFNIIAPGGDGPDDDTTGQYFPVWVNRIVNVSTDQMTLYFATHNTTNNPTTETVEFASLDLLRSMVTGQVVAIVPTDDLQLNSDSGSLFQQGFGIGHVALSSLWSGSSTAVDDFFDSVAALPGSPGEAAFLQSSTRVSSYGISRIPKYSPTKGQAQALAGSSSRLDIPVYPSEDNLFITEADQGLGNTIDFNAVDGITSTTSIDRYGYTGSLARRIVTLCLDYNLIPADTSTDGGSFYDEHILPRLTVLLGRSPIAFDGWFDGTRIKYYTPSGTWLG